MRAIGCSSVLLGVALITACQGSTSVPEEVTQKSFALSAGTGGAATVAATSVTQKNVTVDVVLPSSMPLSSPALVANDLHVGDHSRITTPTGEFATIANVGPLATNLGFGAETGPVISVGSVFPLAGAHVHGPIRTSGSVVGVGYTADGGVTQHVSIPTRHFTRHASFTVKHQSVLVAHDTKRSTPVAPGYYDALSLGARSEATLVAGDYYFESLNIEDAAKLVVDDSNGAAFVYVGSILNHEGQIARLGGGFPRWLVSYLGIGVVFLHGPFLGSILAPKGILDIDATKSDQHEGSFWASKVDVGPNTKIVHREFPWLIHTVAFDKPSVCSGDSVHLAVTTEDAGGSGPAPFVTIDGAPTGSMFDQIVSKPGPHLFAVNAKGSDGAVESLLASIDVAACPPNTPVPPLLFGQADTFHPDSVEFAVINAGDFDDGTQTYDWSFGDGSTLHTTRAAVTHDYSASLPTNAETKPYDVSVTVKRTALPDATTTRTFVVASTYAISKRRGALEPPTRAMSDVLSTSGTDLVATIRFGNVEAVPLTYQQTRVDQIPCDPDAAPKYGSLAPISTGVPANGSVDVQLQVPKSSLDPSTCSVVVHYWGATTAGVKAQVSLPLDLPVVAGSGVRANPQMKALLNFAVDKGLVANPHHVTEEELGNLYRDRRIGFDAATQTYFQSTPPVSSRAPCDPDDPGAAPQPGFACQPTGEWEGDSMGNGALQERIANALKGDTILVRGCSGFVGSLLAAVDPPQLYTHTGIMTKHHFEIANSTGKEDWLQKRHWNGILGKPTDGFDEHALRFLWPGSVVGTVREALVDGKRTTPEGEDWRVTAFSNQPVRCPGDDFIVYPRVLKPAPEFEAATRPKLMGAGDAAKTIHGHYRFFAYSKAQDADLPDPNGPQPITDAQGTTYGPVPTVCSEFVRLSLKKAGFELDHDKSFPQPSDVTNGPPDGLFFYTTEERRSAGNVLYAAVYNKVKHELAGLTAEADNYWWAGLGSAWIIDPRAPLLISPLISNLGMFAGWITDAADDVASQVTNCFATDFCSTDAKDSDRWKDPGTGIAVSPDNLMNHIDSPATGGPYGYNERMIYRGLGFRPVFEWQPTPGSLTLSGTVTLDDGTPAALAEVTIPGFLTTPILTDATGHFMVEGVPRGSITVHAQKFVGDVATGELRGGDGCFVPTDPTDLNSQLVNEVACDNFNQVKPGGAGLSTVTVVLNPPKAEFRKVTISAGLTEYDCDCCGFEQCGNPDKNFTIFKICNVSPLHPTDDVGLNQTDLCDDEVGVKFSAHCQLLADNRTVRVTGSFKLFEDVSNSCGADDEEDSKSFDLTVPEDSSNNENFSQLHSGDVCISPIGIPFDCSDTADIDTFFIQNARSD